MLKPLPFARIAVTMLGMALLTAGLTAGCLPILGQIQTAVAPVDETTIPTPNATLKAISVMLTETRAAPTTTNTPIVTPTNTPTPTATTPPVGSSQRPVVIGQRVTLGGASLTVLSTKTTDTLGKAKADKGSTFLDLEVIIVNDSGANAAGTKAAGTASGAAMDYTPLYFRLQDSSGKTYQPETNALWPALQSGTLRSGEWVRGHVTFLIPTGDSGLRVSYTPQAASGPSPALWVDLAQPPVQAQVPETGPVVTAEPLPGTGKRVETGGIALTVTKVSANARVASTKAGSGNVLVVIQVTIENVSRTLTPYNPEYFTLKDADGYEYPAIVIPAEGLLQAGSLKVNQKVSGQVVFEVPSIDLRLVVEYQPQVLAEDYPMIRVAIDVPAAK